MSSTSQQPAPPPSSARPKTVSPVLVILLCVLAYMLFWLAYDRFYVFPQHEAKYQEIMALVEAETKRSAEAADQDGATGPKEIAEAMGFNSGGLKDAGHFTSERFAYHRGFPLLTRFIEVYYKKDSKGNLYLVGVAHSDEDVLEDSPKPPVVPSELPPGTPDDPVEEEASGEKKTTEEPSDDKKTSEEPAEDVKPEDVKPDDAKAEKGQSDDQKAEDQKSDESDPPAPATDSTKQEG
jgi:hypothetical protein